jgi:hypothetical protein
MSGAERPLQYQAPASIQTSMLALTNSQLKIVMAAASGLSLEKRSLFLERIAARLQLYGPRFTDTEFERAVRSTLSGLIRNSAA